MQAHLPHTERANYPFDFAPPELPRYTIVQGRESGLTMVSEASCYQHGIFPIITQVMLTKWLLINKNSKYITGNTSWNRVCRLGWKEERNCFTWESPECKTVSISLMGQTKYSAAHKSETGTEVCSRGAIIDGYLAYHYSRNSRITNNKHSVWACAHWWTHRSPMRI